MNEMNLKFHIIYAVTEEDMSSRSLYAAMYTF